MQTQRTVDGTLTQPSPEPTPVTTPLVPQRSGRRATARRASQRRAVARPRKDDLEERIVEYLEGHPHSTTGDIAKGLNADRDTVAAQLAHIARASDVSQDEAAQ
jgi:hypothetical protein